MRNILVVTGKMAFETVKGYVGGLADVVMGDVDVAALITPRILRDLLKGLDLSKYDLILLPGNVSSDFDQLEEEFGVRIRLGPRNAHDLPHILKKIDEIELSKRKPACSFLEPDHEQIQRELLELEERSVPAFTIDRVKIGGSSSMKVMAEVVDATGLDDDKLRERVRYFAHEGADIIDLGVGLDATRDDVARAVRVAASATDLPLSIDTMDPELIRAGVDAGARLVLSLDSDNIGEVGGYLANKDVSVVVLSRNGTDELLETIKTAKSVGIKKIIADPVLAPLGHGTVRSICECWKFRAYDPGTPLFFGVGNVTELLDADSIGVNALLAGIGMELGVSILFTPEASRKTAGSVRELVKASRMMRLASKRQTSPKDLGIDLFVAKEKRMREGIPVSDKAPVKVITEEAKWGSDPLGYFRIGLKDGMIYVEHNTPDGRVDVLAGKSAKEIVSYLVKDGRISMIDHGAYLGVELAKAELALRFKRSYVQDEEI